MTTMFAIVGSLFGLKLMWNTCVPYVLWARNAGKAKEEQTGISMALQVDAFLVIALVGVAWFSDGTGWYQSAILTNFVCVASILGSLVLMSLSGYLGKCKAENMARKTSHSL